MRRQTILLRHKIFYFFQIFFPRKMWINVKQQTNCEPGWVAALTLFRREKVELKLFLFDVYCLSWVSPPGGAFGWSKMEGTKGQKKKCILIACFRKIFEFISVAATQTRCHYRNIANESRTFVPIPANTCGLFSLMSLVWIKVEFFLKGLVLSPYSLDYWTNL